MIYISMQHKRKKSNNIDKLSKKDIWMYSVASFVIVCCWIATFIGLYLPPPGEIHSSVLVALGQGILFVATIFGVSYYVKNQLGEFRNFIAEKVKNRKFDDDEIEDSEEES